MALSVKNPVATLSPNDKNLIPLVIFVALAFSFSAGTTVAVFLLVPAIHDSVVMAISEGGKIFIGVVIFPAGILSLVATLWVIRMRWASTSGKPTETTGKG
jgi:hypothetical protein